MNKTGVLNLGNLTAKLFQAAVFLTGLDLIVQVVKFRFGFGTAKGLVPLLDLNREANIPTFFSSLLLVLAALLAWLIHRLGPEKNTTRGIFSAGLFLMGLDEIIQIHETLSRPTTALLGSGKLGIFYHSWVIPGLIIVVACGLFFWKFFSELPSKTRLGFFLAASIYFSGSLAIEAASGLYYEQSGNDWIYNLFVALEEFLEMTGVILLIRALMLHLAQHCPDISIRFKQQKSSAHLP